MQKKLGIDKSVHFVGKVDQKHIPQAYADADVFVFASKSETQGLVIYEAMASGIPVVAVSDPAFAGIITNGESGFLIEDTPRVFAKTVLKVLKDKKLAEKLGRNGRQAMQQYSIDTVAEQMEALYKTLIAKNSKKIDFPFRRLSKYLLNE